jgi:MFS family permease
VRTLFTLTSLLLSTALLLVGHGMQLTLLPLRATGLGYSDFLIGLGASAYFSGFVVGCLYNPRIIARVGHIRSFAVLAAVLLSALLLLAVSDHWIAWILMRFIIGVMICGLYTVIESWLNDQSSSDNRGQVLALYTFVVLMSMALGQLLINAAPIDTATPFILAAVFMALAIVPVGLTRRLAPAPIQSTRTRFSLLYRRSRVAFAGAVLSGLVVGSFWSLGAVFADRTASSVAEVTLFITAAIIGGALLQYPIGWISDRFDRRMMLALLCLLGAAGSIAVAMSVGQAWHIFTVFFYGAMTMPLYAIALAIGADNSESHEFVMIGTSVLLLNALAAALAPLALGQLMDMFGATALFWSFAVMLVLGAAYIMLQRRGEELSPAQDKVPFSAAAPDMAPASFDLDPRSPDHSSGDLAPQGELPSILDRETGASGTAGGPDGER